MTTKSGSGPEFDDSLSQELHQQLGDLSGPSSRVSQSAYHAAFLRGEKMPFRSRLSAIAFSKKAAAGLAVAALAVGSGSVAAAAVTGSSNPSVWGNTVTEAVSDCKDQPAHGIGQCVSDVAKQKGAEERAAHSQGKSDQDHPTGPPTSEPTGPPASHPTGAPGGVPVGPPAFAPPGSENGHPTGPPVSPRTPPVTPPAHR